MEIRMTRPASDPLPTIWNPDQRIGDMLKGKRGLVVGIANADLFPLGGSFGS
jgi:enoyl-[acyl-carrier protein] reductase I